MISRRLGMVGATLALVVLAGCGGDTPAATDAAPKPLTEFRIGFTVTENDPARLAQYEGYRAYIEKAVGVPVKTFNASDYAGVAQAMESGQLDMAAVGPSNYAAMYIAMGDKVRPLVKPGDGDYYSAMYVRADSPYQTVEDLKGKTLAFADINSASGYLIPSYLLRKDGKDPRSFFKNTIFAGGHEQGVMAVLNKQADAGVTWSSLEGGHDSGYSRGIFHRMVGDKLIQMKDLRVIWRGGPIPAGPVVIRSDLPPEVITKLQAAFLAMKTEAPEVFAAVADGESSGFVETTHADYAPFVEMRKEETAQRRAQ
jgi:phosphonate transport system substrate-binding protein